MDHYYTKVDYRDKDCLLTFFNSDNQKIVSKNISKFKIDDIYEDKLMDKQIYKLTFDNGYYVINVKILDCLKESFAEIYDYYYTKVDFVYENYGVHFNRKKEKLVFYTQEGITICKFYINHQARDTFYPKEDTMLFESGLDLYNKMLYDEKFVLRFRDGGRDFLTVQYSKDIFTFIDYTKKKSTINFMYTEALNEAFHDIMDYLR